MIDPARVRPEVFQKMQSFHVDVVNEVKAAIAAHDVVVVGMALNPHVRKVREALDAAKIPYHYVGVGGYASKWKERLALKLWTGWPTFPQVFVKGTFVGGEDLTKAALADGWIQRALAS